MPRSQSSSSSSSSKSSFPVFRPPQRPVFQQRPPVLAPVPMYNHKPPTTGQVLKDSLTSGIGSGIGFSLGNRLMSNFFGSSSSSSTVSPGSAPPGSIGASINPASAKEFTEMKDNMQQCLEHMVEQKEELPLCFFLMKTDPQFLEFQQCMKTSGNQIHMCKEFLPHP